MELPLNLGICLTVTGSFVPATYLDNQQISQMMVTSDEWIATRTGICRRFRPLWNIVGAWQSYFYVTDGWLVYPSFIPESDKILSETYMTRLRGENTRL